MVQPTVLRKRHTLKGVNAVLPLIRRLKASGEQTEALARIQATRLIEEMAMDDLKLAFRNLMDECMGEFLTMVGREANIQNARLLLHHTIILANEMGQPAGQDLQQQVANDTPGTSAQGNVMGDGHITKRPRLESTASTTSDLMGRIKCLEDSLVTGVTEREIHSLRDKVRALCLQANPSEQLIMLSVDELAKASRKAMHEDADTYEELARQVVRQQGRINISSLCLSVIGRKASETIIKALNKCLKEKQIDERASKKAEDEKKQTPSPLANLYPSYMYPTTQYPPPAYYQGQPSYGGQQHGRYMYPRGPRQPRMRGACLFCESTDHYIKDCKRMEQAKKNQRNN